MIFRSLLSMAVAAFIGIVVSPSTAFAAEFRCPSQQVTVSPSGVSYPWNGDEKALSLTALEIDKSTRPAKLACIYGNGAMVLRHPIPAAEPNCSVVRASKFVCRGNTVAPAAGYISYTAPLATGLPPVVGFALRDLTTHAQATTGPFPGVPMNGTKCSQCHQSPTGWTKPELCKRGQMYAVNRARIFTSPTPGFIAQHPFGGQLKTAMANWAQSGCN